jgi:hypothetical protein
MKRLLSVAILSVALLQPAPACTWFEKLFGTCTENNPKGFVPSFEKPFQISRLYGKILPKVPINDTYYATDNTALEIARRFGGSRVFLVPDPWTPDSSNWFPDGTPAAQRYVVFPVGAILKNETGDPIGQVKAEFQVNAGILADYYRRIPEQKFPATDVVIGYPPVIQHRLSNAEQNVWNVLWGVASDAEKDRVAPSPAKIEEEKQNVPSKSERVF